MKNLLNISKKKVFIVAEIGNNHEGSFKVAKKLILKAKKCNVDAVKFQTFNPLNFYQKNQTKKIKKLKKYCLSHEQLKKLSAFAKKKRLIFFSTPLDLESATKLNKIQNVFKIASSDNDYFDLIKHISNFNKDIIISTGFSKLNLLKKIEKTIRRIWKKKKFNLNLSFLHCVSSYPTEFDQSNLFAIKTLKKKFKNCIIGYSDHTKGIFSCLIAVILGARIIEKHFTLDKNFSNFRDHQLSADPDEMATLVKNIRSLERMENLNIIKPQESEKKTYKLSRRSCVLINDLKKDQIIKYDNIVGLRPLKGVSIFNKEKIINKKVNKNMKAGAIINYKDLY